MRSRARARAHARTFKSGSARAYLGNDLPAEVLRICVSALANRPPDNGVVRACWLSPLAGTIGNSRITAGARVRTYDASSAKWWRTRRRWCRPRCRIPSAPRKFFSDIVAPECLRMSQHALRCAVYPFGYGYVNANVRRHVKKSQE